MAGVVLHPMERRHHLVVRVEGELGDAGELAPRHDCVETALLGQHDEGSLGRVADEVAVPDDRIGA